MKYIDIPNLPEKAVKTVIVDGRITYDLEKSLLDYGIRVIKTLEHPLVYSAISYHPDIMLHHIEKEYIIYAPQTHPVLLMRLASEGFKLIEGDSVLTPKYPGSIAYNVARVGNLAFHNLKYTDPILRRELEARNVELVHINQGYAKCSISIVNHNSIITSDAGIAKIAESKGLEVLLIDSEDGIRLQGVDKGFIGGASGLVDCDKWLISGNIDTLKNAQRIYDFLVDRNIEPVSLYGGEVLDIGSILPVLTE